MSQKNYSLLLSVKQETLYTWNLDFKDGFAENSFDTIIKQEPTIWLVYYWTIFERQGKLRHISTIPIMIETFNMDVIVLKKSKKLVCCFSNKQNYRLNFDEL